MKTAIVFAALFAVALAANTRDAAKDETVRFDLDNLGIDGYKFAYETNGGIKHEEDAQVHNLGTDHESLDVKGSYSYIGDDGLTYTVNFVANEGGFQPQGAHLPVA